MSGCFKCQSNPCVCLRRMMLGKQAGDVDLLDDLKDSVSRAKSTPIDPETIQERMEIKAEKQKRKFAKRNGISRKLVEKADRYSGRKLSKSKRDEIMKRAYVEANEAARTTFDEYPTIETNKPSNELITITLPRGVWMFLHRALLIYQSTLVKSQPGVALLMKHLKRMIDL